jgi:hypothetical protein
MAVKPKVIDFTNVSAGGAEFNRAHRVPGDYLAKITGVKAVKSSKTGNPQWLFTIKQGSATYPYYCQFAENTLWKLRTLMAAAGINIPSKKVNLDPNKAVGKEIGISLDDHEYNDKLFSEIIAVFPKAELPGADTEAEDEDEEEEEEDEETEEPEDETEEEEEEEEEEPEPPKRKKKTKAAKKTKRKGVDDEELEELDIEDI